MDHTGEKETISVPPLAVVAVVGAAVLCSAVIYNALAGQDGRQRDVLSRLSDLEQQGALPVTIGVGSLEARPTTKAQVKVEKPSDAEPAGAASLIGDIQQELAALGRYRGNLDGRDGPQLRQAIEAYERANGMDVTGRPSPMLLDHLRLARQIRAAMSAESPAAIDVRSVQEGLARLGYAPGPADGTLGPRTRDAIRMFERDRNLEETGAITDGLVHEIERVLTGGG